MTDDSLLSTICYDHGLTRAELECIMRSKFVVSKDVLEVNVPNGKTDWPLKAPAQIYVDAERTINVTDQVIDLVRRLASI